MVVPLAQTFNGPETPGIRIHDVTNTGFLIRLNEAQVTGSAMSAPARPAGAALPVPLGQPIPWCSPGRYVFL